MSRYPWLPEGYAYLPGTLDIVSPDGKRYRFKSRMGKTRRLAEAEAYLKAEADGRARRPPVAPGLTPSLA